ncbi:DNA-3-methyladenine glycosylase family protein [Aestuariirhabdus litorea]|uniref:DNA-3-methyladenine glycosylase II n=1 Tax=Aestuariirhabdus litorea TaxID=2528527 RepID=A0A3P3VK60_9GAMM|nr:DNA-3-methyladenine glycosylase [Aestuariirhabdus litorea]RRJ82697.1 DNA-3-methyladenine glycosylase 2 family protein [Aestuariirhabdus litorea]RWW92857.1 DNA-3-methyladenine glycosylase 2 family protein [Endozoicomonadaceae bacterium GTF-13]
MDSAQITRAMQSLAASDPQLAQALARIGPPPPRMRPPGFETLLATIVSQQISTQASQAIMGRVKALMPRVTASALLELEAATLRAAGLSFRKIEYARGLAEAVTSGRLDIDGLARLEDQAAIEVISSLRGFGRWSAEIYLMFSLQRPDIFPADDLALLVALGRLKGLPQKPTPRQAREMTAAWSPWRSTASLFLWHYYRGAPT